MVARWKIFLLVPLLFGVPISAEAEKGFLRKGTTALNPKDGRTLFLYIPGYTLLYDLGAIRNIGSRTFGTREKYRLATTQDGIRVLVRYADIRTDVQVLEKYDFLVNRRMPLCQTSKACKDVWNRFTDIKDEGKNWIALWPRTAGKFTKKDKDETRAVYVSIGGAPEHGFVPTHRNKLKLEDSGFISLLNRKYPVYRFTESANKELASPCTYERSVTKGVAVLNKVEAYAKASVNAKLDVAEGLTKPIPKSFARAVLSFLGLEARISAEAFIDGRWKKETSKETLDRILYGNKDEQWEVKTVQIERRLDRKPGGYVPFGNVMVRKVLKCTSGIPTEMSFASFFLTAFPEAEGDSLTAQIINLDADTIKRLGLQNNPLDKGLVSINTQSSHYKLVDFFLSKQVPKGISNFLISEINVAESHR